MKHLLLTLLTSGAVMLTAFAADADNTAKNERDKNPEAVTPTDQSNDPADLKITADIRKMLIADEALSMLAKNAKVITVEKVVTLRGPVETAKEKTIIEKHAKMAGATKVINELEIKES